MLIQIGLPSPTILPIGSINSPNPKLLSATKPYFFSDSELYSIVGYKYLHGDLPTNLHPEVPPLGKMLIGTSIFIFGNANILSLLFAVSSLLLLYVAARYLRLPQSWAIFGLILICFDAQFWDLATSAMLDMFLLTFLLLSFLCFYRGFKNYKWFWFSSLFLGFMASTKLYFTSIVVIGTLIIAILLIGSFKIFIRYLLSLISFTAGFMIPYTTSFISGMSILDFLRFQRWLTAWWAGNSKIPFGGILTIIFQNQWHTWWGKKEIIPVPNWNPLWPITSVFSLLGIFSKNNILLIILLIWTITYLLFLTITSPFPRYLILLCPFWVILALKSIHEAFAWFSHILRRT